VQITNNIIDHRLGVQGAISAPRFFHSKGDVINMECEIPEKVRRSLENFGYRIEIEGAYQFGAASGTLIDEKRDKLYAGVDPRRQYTALGY
jgi:gamma-glutamyltranspeptidase